MLRDPSKALATRIKLAGPISPVGEQPATEKGEMRSCESSSSLESLDRVGERDASLGVIKEISSREHAGGSETKSPSFLRRLFRGKQNAASLNKVDIDKRNESMPKHAGTDESFDCIDAKKVAHELEIDDIKDSIGSMMLDEDDLGI